MTLVWPVAFLLVAGLAGCDSPRKELDRHELSVTVKSLASLSAEAELLVRQFERRDVTAAFAWAHQQALAQESIKLSQQLAKPARGALQPARDEALQLNGRLQATLLRVAQAEGAPDRLEQLQQDLHALGARAHAVEQSL